MSPQTVGRYEITGELGKGAMGVVYTALDPTIGRTVALKTMRLDVHGLEQQEVLMRFRNEARAAGVLNHPNIVTIYDAGEQDGVFYIAMEMIEGTTLHHVLTEQRTLPPERVIELARQICAGLDYAHARGVVHRDVKPANIMITPAGMVKIMDFGIAKSGGTMTTAGQVLGTPNYMSPEQVKGKTLDGRSDLFSLGVILYEMVTGEKPFTGQNVTTIIYKIVNENPISPRELDATIHPGISGVISRTLAKSPDERYQTGALLVRDLENYKSLHGEITSAMSSDIGLKAAALATPHTEAAAAAAAPAPAPVPSAPASSVSSGQVRLASAHPAPPQGRYLLPALIGVMLLIFAIGGFALWRYNRQLEQERERLAAEQARLQQQQAATPAQPVSQDTNTSPTGGETGAEAAPTTAPAVPKPSAAKPAPVKPAERAPEKPGTIVAPNVGEIAITSSPVGVAVMVDGWSDPKWVTPFVASKLAPGEHVLTFTKPGYITHTRRVVVESGKRASVSASLTSSAAMLNLASQPSGAEILVDGKATGKVTPARVEVEQGEHRVVLRLKGYKEAAATARVGEGQTYNFTPSLEPEKGGSGGFSLSKIFGGTSIPKGQGLVDVRTSPRKAEIVVDGRTAPKTTPYKFPLPPGQHTVILRLEGYQPIEKKITVVEGKVVTLNEELKKR